MGIKIGLKNKPVWVEYAEYDDEGNKIAECQFLIRGLTTRENMDFMEKATIRKKEIVFEKGRKVVREVEKIDNYKYFEMVFSAVCLDWKGIEDADGNALECNSENKKRILDENFDMAVFCVQESQNIMNFLNKKKEKEVKN